MRKIKIAGCLAAVILMSALTACVFGERIVLFAVRYELARRLPQYKISFKSAHLRSDSLSLYDIQARDKSASFDAAQVQVAFRLVDLVRGRISNLTVKNMTVRARGLLAKDIDIDFDGKNDGRLSIESVGYEKLSATSIQSPFRLDGNTLEVGPIHAAALDGEIDGRFEMRLDGGRAYELDLLLRKLSLPRLISDLKFEDKMSMTGTFLGKISARGNSSGVDSIDGSLSGSDQGGELVILDEKFLGDIAARMNQPLELVKAGLKEYHYDSGQARLLKNGRDLGLDLSLDGPKGKRNLSTVFHDAV